jgi:hypothetical protein
MHSAVLLQDENSRLQAENARQKRKRVRRAFLQTGGIMATGEGMARNEAFQKAPQKGQGRQKSSSRGGRRKGGAIGNDCAKGAKAGTAKV